MTERDPKEKDRQVKSTTPSDGGPRSQTSETAVATVDQATPPEKDRRIANVPIAPARERRKYKVSETPPPPPPPPRLADYEPIIGGAELDELRFLARHLRGKTVKMVNSTAVGGGVAEILNRLIPLMNELEVHTKWEVITGGNDILQVTMGCYKAQQW